ncbi:formate dehydrogenase accessory sulfurtransferase FdhD [Neorhodopirellula lusitana]|uniref:formate dehydrogenase accessory sulfurtransferase FdhD n=1 Tax=Neorhodopirellula lusitana TaxID=445327 RepID=UPI003850A2E0
MTKVHRDSSRFPVVRVTDGVVSHVIDDVAVESPLEIRLVIGDAAARPTTGIVPEATEHPISVTMRTPGHDTELALGFLLTEGIITSPEQVTRVRLCGNDSTVRVSIAPNVSVDLDRLKRHFYTSSSCGVCGKSAIDAVRVSIREPLDPQLPRVTSGVLVSLPDALRSAQQVFDRTGGLHASGLFTTAGKLIRMHEDVGRHNAMDKLIGAQWFDDESVFSESILLVSGRVSFELVQKALVAGIAVLVAVGAPSSLAVQLAETHGMTLVGFVRNNRMNVYCGAHRITDVA